MKIALINIDDNLGGASIASIRLLNSLKKYTNLDVSLFVQNKTLDNSNIIQIKQGNNYKLKNKLRFIVERLFFLKYEKEKKIRFLFSPAIIGIDLTKKINLLEYDLIHLHWINFGFLSLNNLEKIFELNKPIVWTLHDMWPFTGGCHYSGTCENFKTNCGNCEPFLRNHFKNDLSNKIFLKKQKIYKDKNIYFVGCSKWISNLAKSSNLLPKRHIFNIPNPINNGVFKKLNRERLREKYNLNPDKNYILFLAMNTEDERKGFKYFIDSIFLLRNINIEFEILVVGKINSPLLKTSINLPKTISEDILCEYYNLADVFIAPSLQDNLPNTIVESLSCGTPVVSFNIGGIPEIIDHLETGYLAKYKDSKDMAEGIKWCFENSTNDLREKCIKISIEKFNESKVALKYQSLYNDIINDNKLQA
ncbi:glycosyltransferase [Lacihabitans lacunae]|uniref:Glycosyltransferase n=1 Tax=Lacihabitans lacunae TaxID=1028214 RepID=A0ABV7YRT8_9BACT